MAYYSDVEHTLAKYIALKEIETNQVGMLQAKDILSLQDLEKTVPLKLRGPGIYWIQGKTMSGKTTAISKVCDFLDEMIKFTIKDSEGNVKELPVEEVHYFYHGEWQPNPFDKLERDYNVQFHNKKPQSEDIHHLCKEDRLPRVLVLDDMMEHITSSEAVLELLTKDVHHMNLMVFLVTQMLHPGGKNAVGLRSQGHGYFFFQFTGDDRGLRSRFQSFVGKRHLDALKQFYDAAVERSNGYIYIDCHPLQNSKYFIFRNIFPDEGPTEVFDLKRTQASGVGKKRKHV